MSKEKKKPSETSKPKGQIMQSETVTIKRGQINFAPYNPKVHTEEAVKQQLNNFKNVGFFGGIVWNEVTGNLVSGHKRIMAMDKLFGNTQETPVNYDVKVEKVQMDLKTEMQQNIFMDARSTNTPQDYGMIALILPEIDYKMAGLSADELNLISIESPLMDIAPRQEIKQDYKELGKDYEQKKADIKEAKQKIKENVAENQGETYVTLSFDNYENKCAFMERFGFKIDLRFINGESFSDSIERVL